MPSWPALLSQAFNGLALGALLALVSSGLTIILGTLGVLNFAHGALFAVGAYAVFVILQYTQSFVLALVIGCGFMLLLGFLLERIIIRLFYNRPHEDQILVTYGVGIVLVECIRAAFGGNAQRVPTPSWGQGATQTRLPDLPDLPAATDCDHRDAAAEPVSRAVSHLDGARCPGRN